MVDLDALKQDALAECEEDHVGLWSIVWTVRRHLPQADSRQVRQTTMKLLEDLLREGSIEAGTPSPNGRDFKSWNLPAEAVIERIDAEWDRLGREPNIGEIVWFTSMCRNP